MKKLLALLCLFIFWFTLTYAYTPTDDDLNQLVNLKAQLSSLTATDNEALRNYYYQLKLLRKKYMFDDRLDYMLRYLWDYLRNLIFVRKTQAKAISMQDKKEFLDIYSGEIITDKELWDNCVGWYNTIDDIAFTHDFPTSVLIWTRYRESTCGYYLPKNGRWPFQITSKNYWTGEISEEVFVDALIDFIHFAKNKYSRYENTNSNSWLKINLNYKTLSYTWIIRHGALYNGLSWHTVYWNILPIKPGYVFDNYTNSYSGASKNGVLTQSLKVLEWELINKY